MISRAVTSKGTPLSIAAMVTVSDFVRLSQLAVKAGIRSGGGNAVNDSASACRPLSSCGHIPLTTPARTHRKPLCSKLRHSSVPFLCRQPIARRAIRDRAPTSFLSIERHRFVAL